MVSLRVFPRLTSSSTYITVHPTVNKKGTKVSSEIKFSTIINLAIEKYLASPTDLCNIYDCNRTSKYSCDAIQKACLELFHEKDVYESRYKANEKFREIKEYLKEFGLDCSRHYAFGEFENYEKSTEESQNARALWLTWVAMIAEEEGN